MRFQLQTPRKFQWCRRQLNLLWKLNLQRSHCAVALWHRGDGLWVRSAETAWYFSLKTQNAGDRGLVSDNVCKLKWALKIAKASETMETELGKIPPPLSAHIQGEKSTEDSRAGCVLRLLCSSQRVGVATCLLSVLLQPSCGSTLVDFLEITWHSHWGPLCLCRTLQWSARASSSFSSCLYPPQLQKRRLGLPVFEHIRSFHKHNISFFFHKKSQMLRSLLLSKLTNDWQLHLFLPFWIAHRLHLLYSSWLVNQICLYPEFSYLSTQIIVNKSRPPAGGFYFQTNRKQHLPNKQNLNGICPWHSGLQEV